MHVFVCMSFCVCTRACVYWVVCVLCMRACVVCMCLCFYEKERESVCECVCVD